MSEEIKSSNLVKALQDAAGDLLTEDTLKAIEVSFNESVNAKVDELVHLHIEKALVEQDEEHATKLESLLEAIDTDHTVKLQKVLKAVNENHAYKMQQVAKKYGTGMVQEAQDFKDSIVDKISNYLELYIENSIPIQDIKEAVKNKRATEQLQEMRKFLAVNFALSKGAIKDAIRDGKKQIVESKQQSTSLIDENEQLKENLGNLEREKLLAIKTKGLPVVKRKYISRVLSDKSIDFIEENFEYTLQMFEKSEEEKLDTYKKQATRKRVVVDRPVRERVISEQADPNMPATADPVGYMDELKKF